MIVGRKPSFILELSQECKSRFHTGSGAIFPYIRFIIGTIAYVTLWKHLICRGKVGVYGKVAVVQFPHEPLSVCL